MKICNDNDIEIIFAFPDIFKWLNFKWSNSNDQIQMIDFHISDSNFIPIGLWNFHRKRNEEKSSQAYVWNHPGNECSEIFIALKQKLHNKAQILTKLKC